MYIYLHTIIKRLKDFNCINIFWNITWWFISAMSCMNLTHALYKHGRIIILYVIYVHEADWWRTLSFIGSFHLKKIHIHVYTYYLKIIINYQYHIYIVNWITCLNCRFLIIHKILIITLICEMSLWQNWNYCSHLSLIHI